MMAFRSIRALSLAAVLVSAVAATATAGTPFLVIRGISNAGGTSWYVGGAGMTVTHPSTGHYHVAFPANTWRTFVGSTPQACYFIPQVQAIGTTATAVITTYTPGTDLGGSIDITMSNSADAMIAMVFTSSNC